MVVEHELMHHETLLYMLQELDHGLKRRPADWPALPASREPRPARPVEIPAGEAVLGARSDSIPFGWDNEFPQMRVHVPAFAIDDRPVTNAEMLAFVEAGGYERAALWRAEDWAWRARRGITRPHSFRSAGECLAVRGLLEDVPFETAAHWPAVGELGRGRGLRALARGPAADRGRVAPRGRGDRAAPGQRRPPNVATSAHGSPVPVGAHPDGRERVGRPGARRQRLGVDVERLRAVPGLRADAALPRLLGRLLRRRATT